MDCFPIKYNPFNKNDILNKSLNIRLQKKRANEWLKWSIVNFIIFIILLIDILNKCPYDFSKWYYIEYIIITISGFNLIVYILRYISFTFSFNPVKGTIEQKQLLQFDDNDNSFVVDSSKTEIGIQPTEMNATILSWHSSFNDLNRSYGLSYQTNPHLNQSKTGTGKQNTSLNSSLCNSSSNTNSKISLDSSFNSSYRKYLKDEIITDERALQKFLKKMSKQETTSTTELHSGQTTFNQQTISSFWHCYNTAASLLKTSLYQLSPTTSAILPIKQIGKIEGDFEGVPEIFKKMSPAKLSQYVANLRMWISITILQRIEREINRIDESFRSRGFTDLQIGNVGLERLKKTVENKQFVSLHVPMLPLIVPFLEMSTNQEYLVQRIKDLSKGSCIADYRSNSGSSYHGLNWDEHLPADSAIIFHLFCTYFDSQLMPIPQCGGRPFFSRYVVNGDKKSPKDTLNEIETINKAKCAILCTNQLKPRFNFISDNKIHNCVYDRNNLFYVIIQFLFYIKNEYGGVLEGTNLGRSGINILCVIED